MSISTVQQADRRPWALVRALLAVWRRVANLPAAILLAAFLLRMVYAHSLPLNVDEEWQLDLARTISLDPDRLNLPLGHAHMNHGMGIPYMLAILDWLGGGSAILIRVVFAMLNTSGLLAVYLLAARFFGRRAALIAVALGAIDQHLVAGGPLFQATNHLFLVAWPLLAADRAVERMRHRDWLLFGLAVGLAWNFYQLTALVLPAVAVYLVASRRLGQVVRQPGPYLGAAMAVALVAPNLAWDLMHQAPTAGYILQKGTSLGLTPRFFLLYLEPLILWPVEAWRVALLEGDVFRMVSQVPCAWPSGVLCLVCTAYAAWRWREGRYGFLLAAVGVPALIVSIVAPAEPFNGGWWAAGTLVPVLCLTGHVLNRVSRRGLAGQTILAAAGIGLMIQLGIFLAGPKWGYFSPDWEKTLIGRYAWLAQSGRQDEALEDVRQAVRQHPDSLIAPLLLATDPDASLAERRQAMDCAEAIDPQNPLLLEYRARGLTRQGRYADAEADLRAAIAQVPDCADLRENLAAVLASLGQYEEAEREALGALAFKPDAYVVLRHLFCIRIARDNATGAFEALDLFARRENHPDSVYWKAGDWLASKDMPNLARQCYDKARQLNPLLPPPSLPANSPQPRPADVR